MEDIKILEEWIKVDREIRNNSTESDFDKFCEEKNIAIENLINRNKELEEMVKIKNGDIEYLQNKINKHFISDSKIAEKIKELQAKGRIKNETFANCGDYIYQDKIQVLQELLEE